MMRSWITAALLTGLLVSCSESPESAYKRIVFNARTGNEAAFLKGFTPDSARLVKTMIALKRTYGTQTRSAADPYTSLVLETVTEVRIETETLGNEERDIATLDVTDGSRTQSIRMV